MATFAVTLWVAALLVWFCVHTVRARTADPGPSKARFLANFRRMVNIQFLQYQQGMPYSRRDLREILGVLDRLHRRDPSPTPMASAVKVGEIVVPPVREVVLELSHDLLHFADPKQKPVLPGLIADLRREFKKQLGVLLPSVTFMDNLQLPANTFRLLIREVPMTIGHLNPERMVDSLRDVLQPHLPDLLTRQAVVGMLFPLYKSHPALYAKAQRSITVARLQHVLQALLRDGYSLANLPLIVQCAALEADQTVDHMTARCRTALREANRTVAIEDPPANAPPRLREAAAAYAYFCRRWGREYTDWILCRLSYDERLQLGQAAALLAAEGPQKLDLGSLGDTLQSASDPDDIRDVVLSFLRQTLPPPARMAPLARLLACLPHPEEVTRRVMERLPLGDQTHLISELSNRRHADQALFDDFVAFCRTPAPTYPVLLQTAADRICRTDPEGAAQAVSTLWLTERSPGVVLSQVDPGTLAAQLVAYTRRPREPQAATSADQAARFLAYLSPEGAAAVRQALAPSTVATCPRGQKVSADLLRAFLGCYQSTHPAVFSSQ